MIQDNTQKGGFDTFDASGYRIGIVVSRFNHDITDKILEKAILKLESYDVFRERIEVFHVAGSIEIPIILQDLAKREKDYDCLIAIGAVIEGETAHFKYVCKMVTEGVLRVSLDNHIPIGFAVLTVSSKQQAERRFNIGADAAEAAVQARRLLKADR